MFGFGIFTYLKIGLVVVVLAVCGYFVYEYKHMATVIKDQQVQIDNLKTEQEVQGKKQQAFEVFMAKKPVIQRRVAGEKAQIDKEVGTTDDAGLAALYNRYRLQPDGQVRPAANGKGRRAKPAPGPTPGSP